MGGAPVFLEPVILQDGHRRLEVGGAKAGLILSGEPGGGAHFLGDGSGDVGIALLIFGHDCAQQIQPFRAGGAAEAFEGGIGGFRGAIDIRGRAHRDAAHRLFGGRVDDIERLHAVDGIDPLAVDVEFQCLAHVTLPNLCGA